jgi:hypothetical protein
MSIRILRGVQKHGNLKVGAFIKFDQEQDDWMRRGGM